MLKFQWMNLYKYCSCLKREKRLLGLRRLGVRVPYGAPNQKDTREGMSVIRMSCEHSTSEWSEGDRNV